MKTVRSALSLVFLALLSAVPGHSSDDFFKIKNNDSVQYTVYIYENSATKEVQTTYRPEWRFTTKDYRVVVPSGRTVGFDAAWVKASRPESQNHIYKIIIEGGEGGNKEFSVRSMKANFAYKFMVSDNPHDDDSKNDAWYGLHDPCTLVITHKTPSIAPK